MKYSLPPFNEKEKREFFEQKILDFSENLFSAPFFGFLLSLIFNMIYLYSWLITSNEQNLFLYTFISFVLLFISMT